MKKAVLETVGQHFRPEFINRIDDIVVFHPLGREHIRRIVEIQTGYLRRRLAERDIRIELDTAAQDLLGEAGFDPVYGARPLKRAIQQQLENPLAQQHPGGRVRPGRRDPGRVEGRHAGYAKIAGEGSRCRFTNTSAPPAGTTTKSCRR